MALPTTGLKLSDVIAHMSDRGVGTFTKLSECIAAFDESYANDTYYTAPPDRLGDFSGYNVVAFDHMRCIEVPDAASPGSYEVDGIAGWSSSDNAKYPITTTTDSSDGSKAILFTLNSAYANQSGYKDFFTFYNGRKYKVFFDAKKSGTSEDSSIEIFGQKAILTTSFQTYSFTKYFPITDQTQMIVKVIDNAAVAGNGDVTLDNLYFMTPRDIMVPGNAASAVDEADSTAGWSLYDPSNGTFNSIGSGVYSDYALSMQYTNSTDNQTFYVLSDGVVFRPTERYTIRFKYRYSENIGKVGKLVKFQLTKTDGTTPVDLGTFTNPDGNWKSFEVTNYYFTSETAKSFKFVMDSHTNLDLFEFDEFEFLIDCVKAPSAPTGLSSSNITSSTFTLSWNAPADNGGRVITDYKIYRNGSYYGNVGSTSTTKNITGQSAGSTATWTVKAVNAIGDGDSSAGLSVTMVSGVTVKAVNMSSSGSGSPLTACNYTAGGIKYYDGSGSVPVVGNYIYTDSPGTTKFNGNNLYYNCINDSITIKIDTTGKVVDSLGCGVI